MPDFMLAGKRALITGGSHGIGLAVAHKLADEGVSVALLSRNEQMLKKESNELSIYK
jgi:short-subunit dehydrogenase